MSKEADICLVDMPFGVLTNPAFGISLLKAEALRGNISCTIEYGSIEFSKYISYPIFKYFQEMAVFYMNAVEILFEPYAGHKEYKSWEETIDYLKTNYNVTDNRFDEMLRLLYETKDSVENFLDEFSDKILSHNPKLVGSTWSFQQCNSTLAILKRIKEKNPDVITFIGGCSVSEYAGQAVIDNKEFVDYVFVGESDDIFNECCLLMMDKKKDELHNKFPFILKKGGKGEYHAVENLNDIAYPDYDDYFETLNNSPLKDKILPALPVESSRGCWWGCKGKCNFCGLHTDPRNLKFREKDINRFIDELKFLRDKYGISSFFMTDCILSRKYIKEFPDLVENEGFTFFCEVKTNMTEEEIAGIRRAGFTYLQPGLEGINDGLLKHMNKGNKAIKHVEFLKNCRNYGITLFWNLMKVFPGENLEWYRETKEVIPLLVHLRPPNNSNYTHQRNSKFRTMAMDMGIEIQPAGFYDYYYGSELGSDPNFHEIFEEKVLNSNELHKAVEDEVDNWAKEFVKGHTLSYYFVNNLLAVLDTRDCAVNKRYAFDGLEKEILMGCDQAIKRAKLIEKLSSFSEAEINKKIDEFIKNKLVLEIGDEIIFLAIKKDRVVFKAEKRFAFGLLYD